MSRNNRTNFYPKVVVNGSTINEFGNSYYSRFFEIKRAMSSYTVKSEDVARPDLISYKNFGTIAHWWIIMKVNQVFDMWNDLYEGQTLQIPDLLDIDDFVIASAKAAQ